MTKAKEALHDTPGAIVDKMDLFDLASIDEFAACVLAATDSLYILVNNAGIMAPPPTRDTRGYESQFTVNHLGHFQLT